MKFIFDLSLKQINYLYNFLFHARLDNENDIEKLESDHSNNLISDTDYDIFITDYNNSKRMISDILKLFGSID